MRYKCMAGLYQALSKDINSKTGNAIATVEVATKYTGYGVHHDPNIEYLQPYPVVIVPSAFTRIETPPDGPFPGP